MTDRPTRYSRISRMSGVRGYSDAKKGMTALLNVEPATRTLDLVRFIFHFCNTVNFTLGIIAFGVGIGYDLILINIAKNSAIDNMRTKFLVTGGLVAVHGLIGAYGCVMKQGRCLILYGCLGLCLLILGPVAGWWAYLNGPRVAVEGGQIFAESYYNQTAANRTEKENYLLKVLLETNCQMDHLVDLNFTKIRKDGSERQILDKLHGGPPELPPGIRPKPSCIMYVRDRTMMRIRDMYLVLFLLSATQSVCLLCDILFIFWTLKEESLERRRSVDSLGYEIEDQGNMCTRYLCCEKRVEEGSEEGEASHRPTVGVIVEEEA